MATHRIWTILLILTAQLLGGCFYFGKNDFEDVVSRSSEDWSTRDCLTVILGVIQHNVYDLENPNVNIVALPFYPSVIAAVERRAHILGPLNYRPFTYAHTIETYRHRLDSALEREAGITFDWSKGEFVDSRGSYLRDPTQLDLIMFYVSLTNPSWPGIPPDENPDIRNLESTVVLRNDQGEALNPRYVWGRRNARLTSEETLVIMFPLRNDRSHFLANSRGMHLEFNGFDRPVVLEFPLSRMR